MKEANVITDRFRINSTSSYYLYMAVTFSFLSTLSDNAVSDLVALLVLYIAVSSINTFY